MDKILVSSGFFAKTLESLRREYEVVDIPDHVESLEYLRTCNKLPLVVVIGHASKPDPSGKFPEGQADSAHLAHTMLREVLKIDPDIPVIVSSSEMTSVTIVEHVKRGAFDYVVEPTDKSGELLDAYTHSLLFALKRAVQWRMTYFENQQLRQRVDKAQASPTIITRSSAMHRVLNIANKVAPTPATVLVSGPSGTGKELVARYIHDQSNRSDQSFVAINCGAMSESLLQSELFGHVKGAFTGAESHNPGLIRHAGIGTLFLDEIASVSPTFQVSLLRVLEEKIARPVGGKTEYPVNCRFIAASNENLEQLVAKGTFREDLFYRLNVLQLNLPALCDRPEDIPVLSNYFLNLSAKEYSRDIVGFEPAAMEMLEQFDWPGNVRQLRNAIERAVILCESRRITSADLMDRIRVKRQTSETVAPVDYSIQMAEFEKQLLHGALEKSDNNISKAARLLNMKRTTMRYKAQNLGLIS